MELCLVRTEKFKEKMAERSSIIKRNRNNLQIHTSLLYLFRSISLSNPSLQQSEEAIRSRHSSIVIVILSSLFSDGLQSRRMRSLTWANDGGGSNFNPWIQISTLLGHCRYWSELWMEEVKLGVGTSKLMGCRPQTSEDGDGSLSWVLTLRFNERKEGWWTEGLVSCCFSKGLWEWEMG